jgi:hypothetical protein
MLDHQKLVVQLDKASKDLCLKFAQEKDIAKQVWQSIAHDADLAQKIQEKKWPFLVPHWSGPIGIPKNIDPVSLPYAVLAVDGSQIYYDKHQGPACYLINVGSVLLRYGSEKSSVVFASQPTVIVSSHDQSGAQGKDFVNEQREAFELISAVEQSDNYLKQNHDELFVCLFDGTLIFSTTQGLQQLMQGDDAQNFVLVYLAELEKLYERKILHAGYISFPRSKELVNVLKISASDYEVKKEESFELLGGLCDMDIAFYFLKQGQRSIVFQSKSPISYAYPKHLKPYFCYMHVGFEIIRLEFPFWIACNESLVDKICQVAFDQAQKGAGYPVCLFEAHEQAVIKSMDREFFYLMVQKMTQKHQGSYQASYKSMKKAQVPV